MAIQDQIGKAAENLADARTVASHYPDALGSGDRFSVKHLRDHLRPVFAEVGFGSIRLAQRFGSVVVVEESPDFELDEFIAKLVERRPDVLPAVVALVRGWR